MSPQAYDENMGPDYERWSNTDENDVEDPVEMTPLEDACISEPLASGTNV